MSVTQASWLGLWRQLGAAAPEAVFAQLVAAYSEPHRHYHTLQHLRECLALFEQARDLAQRHGEIGLALWFHDAVYDVHRADNEQRSADWASRCARQAGLADDAARRIQALVMATRHNAPAEGTDQQLLVDVDLAILGADAGRFDEYEAQVRREYAHVPEAQFRERRRRILEGFLARPRIYATPAFFASHEQAARDNLRRSIARLQQP